MLSGNIDEAEGLRKPSEMKEPTTDHELLREYVATANPQPGIITSNASLTVLPDSDGDGLTNEWEAVNGLSVTNAADAALDLDGDGISNWTEFLVGTDPSDPQSYLRIGSISRDTPSNWSLQFFATANLTYSLQECDAFTPDAAWRSTADIPAMPTNRIVHIVRPASGGSSKMFRLVTPRTP